MAFRILESRNEKSLTFRADLKPVFFFLWFRVWKLCTLWDWVWGGDQSLRKADCGGGNWSRGKREERWGVERGGGVTSVLVGTWATLLVLSLIICTFLCLEFWWNAYALRWVICYTWEIRELVSQFFLLKGKLRFLLDVKAQFLAVSSNSMMHEKLENLS